MQRIRHESLVYVPVCHEALVARHPSHVPLAGGRRVHLLIDKVDALLYSIQGLGFMANLLDSLKKRGVVARWGSFVADVCLLQQTLKYPTSALIHRPCCRDGRRTAVAP